MIAKGCRFVSLKSWQRFKIDCGEAYAENQGITHVKWVNFMVCELYFSKAVKTKDLKINA